MGTSAAVITVGETHLGIGSELKSDCTGPERLGEEAWAGGRGFKLLSAPDLLVRLTPQFPVRVPLPVSKTQGLCQELWDPSLPVPVVATSCF